MKKIKELLKPFIAIIFGALLFLFFFNYLGLGGSGLAIGIVAIVLSVYFLVVGILSVVLGDKLGEAKKLLNLIGVATFSLFMGVIFLLTLVGNARNDRTYLGPNGWTIAILSIAAAFGTGILLIIAYFVRSKEFHRVAFLFGAIFVLALLLDVLISEGFAVALGDIVVLQVILYAAYASMLFDVFTSLSENKEPDDKEEHQEKQPIE